MMLPRSKWVYCNYYFSEGMYFYDNDYSYLVDSEGIIINKNKLTNQATLNLSVEPLKSQCCVSQYGAFKIVNSNLYSFSKTSITLIKKDVVQPQPIFQAILGNIIYAWVDNNLVEIDIHGQKKNQRVVNDLLLLNSNSKFIYGVTSKGIFNLTDNTTIYDGKINAVQQSGYTFQIKISLKCYFMIPLIDFQFKYELLDFYKLEDYVVGYLGLRVRSAVLPSNYPESRYRSFNILQRKQLLLDVPFNKIKNVVKQQSQTDIIKKSTVSVHVKQIKQAKLVQKEPIQKITESIPLKKLKQVTQEIEVVELPIICKQLDALQRYENFRNDSQMIRISMLEQVPHFSVQPNQQQLNTEILSNIVLLLQKICTKLGCE
ncbi:hypothetical protein SS50377_22075 [Spironucleus salmonicida]|uniref:Uncharacterized protein n=1 Tax=Spironucleus salmonicida TaxID=348837 RepID=V6LNF1_9EUKA|nr:hypothetical protein SS50377_22075 [Spironucleus salmonicida]|eukprot:EST45763.1 Hypothetical protein SS50377_14334 [Spironucleus salmonicida]